MALQQNMTPIYWPSGPLEIAKRQKSKSFKAEETQVLEEWHKPAALGILQGSPFDCIMLNWAAGQPEDEKQWQTAGPLVAAAKQRGLAVLGFVEGDGSHDKAIEAAKTAGLTAVAVKGNPAKPDPLVMPWFERSSPDWATKAPVLLTADHSWPGVIGQQGGASEAAPTGTPWVESNGWYAQMAQARGSAPVWMMFDPPSGNNIVRAGAYVNAVLDTESYGARWVVSLDANLRAGLLKGDEASKQTLAGISSGIQLFAKHKDWKTFRPAGLLGVISDFVGENFDLSGELIKLTMRRGLLSKALWKSRLAAGSFTGLKALTYTDKEKPAAGLRASMMAFVQQGGVLFTGPNWGTEGKSAGPDAHARWDLRSLGKGRLVVSKEEIADPFEAAVDMQSIFSRANDLVRMFNGATSGCANYTVSPDGKRALIQVINYSAGGGPAAGGARSNITVWMKRRYRGARMYGLSLEAPVQLKPVAMEGGYEFHIESMPSFAAIEFDV
jgi:hypothetical protein